MQNPILSSAIAAAAAFLIGAIVVVWQVRARNRRKVAFDAYADREIRRARPGRLRSGHRVALAVVREQNARR